MEERIALYLYRKIGEEDNAELLLTNERVTDIRKDEFDFVREFNIPESNVGVAYASFFDSPGEAVLLGRLESLESQL